MKDLTHVKEIAENMFTLSAELLRLVDMDEQERRSFIEEVKKMPSATFYCFPA